MIPASTRIIDEQRPRALFLCLGLFIALLLLPASSAVAQIANGGLDTDPGMGMRGGRNTIDGRVYYPSGQRVDKRLRVRVSSVNVGEFSTMTDDNGAFTFRRLREGTYFITVEAGKEYLQGSGTVSFFDNRGQVQTVQIDLQLKTETRNKPGVINAALANVPKPALDLYKQALESEQAGDNKKAIEQLKSAIALYPKFILALNELGSQYEKARDLDKAAEAFNSAIKAGPDIFVLHLNYGSVLMQKKQFAESEAALRRAIELKETSGIAHLYRGKVLIRLSKYSEGEKELQRAISLGGPEAAMAYRYLGALYMEQKKNTQAVESLEKYLSLNTQAKDADQIRQIIKQLRDQ